MSAHILLVEDDVFQSTMIAALLSNKYGYSVSQAQSGKDAFSVLQKTNSPVQLMILDYYLGEEQGSEILDLMKQQYPHIPVIMLTGAKDIDVAVKAMQAGAVDFLSKPPEPERLRISIQNALRLSVLEKEVTRLKKKEDGAFTFDNLIGHDACLSRETVLGRKAAAATIPVLLTGETGVGKEVFARAIHGESTRAGKPFVAVNCGAIPRDLVESTLFGHEKGAFTGAVAKSVGRFMQAHGGTIFLDEIGELPLDAQVKLLRILQQKEVMPVGGQSALPIDVRVISATNRDLEKEVREGRFREDLFFRINVLHIRLPALRERREDIPALAMHFIERFAATESLPLKSLSPDALETLQARDWKGNVRELENIIHRALVLSEGKQLEKSDFLNSSAPNAGTGAMAAAQANGFSFTHPDGSLKTIAEMQQEAMAFSLAHFNNNVTKASTALGIAKSTFYRKIKDGD